MTMVLGLPLDSRGSLKERTLKVFEQILKIQIVPGNSFLYFCIQYLENVEK